MAEDKIDKVEKINREYLTVVMNFLCYLKQKAEADAVQIEYEKQVEKNSKKR